MTAPCRSVTPVASVRPRDPETITSAAATTAQRRLKNLSHRKSLATLGISLGGGGFTSAGPGTSWTAGVIPGPWSSTRRRPSRSATSCAEVIRSAGSLACSSEISSHSHSGTSGMISRIGRGVSSTTRLSTAIVFAAWNGGRPLHIVQSTLPRLNRSARWSIVSPSACSGAMYIGVPAINPDCVMLASSAARAKPKSVIFTCSKPSSSRMLPGLMSR